MTRQEPLQRASIKQVYTSLSDYGRKLWRDCRPLDGFAIEYLAARGCAIPPADGDLRCHPLCAIPTATSGRRLSHLSAMR